MSLAQYIASINAQIDAAAEEDQLPPGLKRLPSDIEQLGPRDAQALSLMMELDGVLANNLLKGKEREDRVAMLEAASGELLEYVKRKVAEQKESAAEVADSAIAQAMRH